MSKKVIIWSAEIFDETDKKKVGKFKTRVPSNTAGAIHFFGTSNLDKKEYSHHGLLRDEVSGNLRWIDKIQQVIDGRVRGQKLVLYIESEKFLHKIEFKYNASILKSIIGKLLNMGKDLITTPIIMKYLVEAKKDEEKKVVTNAKGEIIWKDSVLISTKDENIKEKYSGDIWKNIVNENNLQWTKSINSKGVEEWETKNVCAYWDNHIANFQMSLLNNNIAVPFCYNSYICSTLSNPSGAKNLTKEYIEKSKERYLEIKGQYVFANSNKSNSNADDIDLDNVDEQYGSDGVSVIGTKPIIPIERADSLPSFPTFAKNEELPIVEDDLPF